MNLQDGLKLIGKPAEIPDCSRDDLPQFFVDMGFRVGAEIGVEKGEFAQKFCQAGLTLYAIDPWQTHENFYEHARQLLSPYKNCTIIKKTSVEAVENFADASLDFVYIDANHEFRYIAEDLYEWTKKVRSGGIISGHDYFFTKHRKGPQVWHVGYVLKAYIEAYDIPSWYVIGRKEKLPNEKRDKWRSWMFIKP